MKSFIVQSLSLIVGVIILSIFQYLRYGKFITISYQSEGLLVAIIFILLGVFSLMIRLFFGSSFIANTAIAFDVIGVYGVKLLASHIFKDDVVLVSLMIGLVVGLYVFIVRKRPMLHDVLQE